MRHRPAVRRQRSATAKGGYLLFDPRQRANQIKEQMDPGHAIGRFFWDAPHERRD